SDNSAPNLTTFLKTHADCTAPPLLLTAPPASVTYAHLPHSAPPPFATLTERDGLCLRVARGHGRQVRMRGSAIDESFPESERSQRQREPQKFPEARVRSLGACAVPADGGGVVAQFHDVAAGGAERAPSHRDDGRSRCVMQVQTQTTLQQTDALLTQTVRAQNHQHPPTRLHTLEN
ncbi:hypothetical protein M9458_031154, partial [Cirrhinus mrigala]